ncbi:hypothetical protein K461DRAFT_229845 [Myriangium duriaei CBS 260.36]|uniref:MFS maltose permease n=1 Tax=Myriangium duriaei CBS 260.36 TaxID=1168546 RepID=A0A9P4MEQ2_9PEZI|nr:hypothetical protein K461DRAFT_229845 [Myriangium duriaei CBS 260.36]
MLKRSLRWTLALPQASPRWPATKSPTRPRAFTSRYPLLLVTRNASPRPRLPFLPQASPHSKQLLLQRQVARVLSTENKQYVKQQTWFGVKLCIGAFVVFNLVGFGLMSFHDEMVEKEKPSPPEWTYLTRTAWRAALDEADTNNKRLRPVDPAKVANFYLACLRRLEDSASDGKELGKLAVPEEEAYEIVRDVAPIALDASRKSNEWKAGYVEVILGLGKAAEHSQHLVYDNSRAQFFPETSVVGPSNPRPRKLPSDVTPPKEEDCVRGIPDPEVIYNRVVYGAGFTPKQRIDVHHALANWLHFTKNEAAADQQYSQALEIAKAAYGNQVDASTLSPNLLAAYKQQATHLARTDRISSAVPIFLSCLQSVRTASSTSSALPTPAPTSAPAPPSSNPLANLSKRLFREDVYPLPTTTGNEPLTTLPRPALSCHEAELLLYIGEILFSSSRHADGLAWTREATELAAADAKEVARASGLQKEDEERCKGCVGAGAGNWEAMVGQMVKQLEGQKNGWWGGSKRKEELERTREAGAVLDGVKARLLGDGVVDPGVFLPRGT